MKMKAKDVLGKKILAVIAHPDDESFLASGTLWKNRAAGGRSYVFCATLGERGKAYLKKEISTSELKLIRRRELRAVSKFLGVSRIAIVGVPDGEVIKPRYKKRLNDALTRFLGQVRPDIVMSFGSDGISGHLDHIAISRIARDAAKKFRIPFLAFCMSPKLHSLWQHLKRRRKHGVYVNSITYNKPTFKISADPRIKLKALRLHKSQLNKGDPFSGVPKAAIPYFLKWEYFHHHTNARA